MTQAFNLLKREGGRQKHRVRNIWGEMIESRVIIEYNDVMHPSRGERPPIAEAIESGVSTPGEARKPKVSEE
jgi:hypothetical protein